MPIYTKHRPRHRVNTVFHRRRYPRRSFDRVSPLPCIGLEGGVEVRACDPPINSLSNHDKPVIQHAVKQPHYTLSLPNVTILYPQFKAPEYLDNKMGCCLSKKPKKRPQVSATHIAPPQATAIQGVQEKPVLEHAKLWLHESPKKQAESEKEKQEVVQQPMAAQQGTPEGISKRRQLLRELFRQARAKQGKEGAKQHKLNIQKMETMESACEGTEERGRALQQAIRQMVLSNKEELTICGICTEPYTTTRLPMMVCMNQHTYCSECLNDLWKKGHRKCPLDQTPYNIDSLHKNRMVISILEQLPHKE